MAKKNGRDDPPKPQVAENEQMSDIILILDKMELILQAVSQIDKDGRYKTVPADKEHTNSFLKIDRYASMFENFLKNFWSQLKDPTRFGILSVKEKALDDPKVRQAIEDLAAGKKTDAVEEFLKQYEIVPRDKENQSINHQNQEEMAKENETQQQAAQGGGTQQQPQYRYNESMINWEQLKNFGLSREELQERGLLDQMLRGYKTNQVVPISMNFGSAVLRTDARLSFQQSRAGDIVLGIHGIRQKPDLDRPYFGHIFSDEDKKNLLETGNMGRVVELKNRNGEYVPSFVSIDKLTNEVVAMKAENVFIPREISGVKLTEQEQNDLREGKKIFIEGMTARSGNPFDAHIQVNAERRGVEFIFENDKLFNRQYLGGVELTKKQIDDLNGGKAIFVEGMKRKDGELFSSYVKLDEATGRPSYTRYNPDSPEGAREIYIPNEIGGVKVTPEEQKELREGRPIFLNGMVYVGGVVGAQIDGSITGCSSSATVKGMVDVGGVAGQTNSNATLTACYATGNVTLEIAPKKNIAGGGLVGMNAGSSLLACYATGNVTSTGSSTGYVHIGGFLGDNYITVTACYWKNNHEQGIGYNRESTKVTKVDGSVVTWQKAVDAMNTALQNAGSKWRYELKGALPTLRKQ